eukprot:scaffold8204_cov177-Amphora_coffeaeformis.AAC.5
MEKISVTTGMLSNRSQPKTRAPVAKPFTVTPGVHHSCECFFDHDVKFGSGPGFLEVQDSAQYFTMFL